MTGISPISLFCRKDLKPRATAVDSDNIIMTVQIWGRQSPDEAILVCYVRPDGNYYNPDFLNSKTATNGTPAKREAKYVAKGPVTKDRSLIDSALRRFNKMQ